MNKRAVVTAKPSVDDPPVAVIVNRDQRFSDEVVVEQAGLMRSCSPPMASDAAVARRRQILTRTMLTEMCLGSIFHVAPSLARA
ncbi:MAG: hypothetical protein JWQ42_931 [Edaphobacter sp.]|nr:hypothetical protein [Edaphobacter sp.]